MHWPGHTTACLPSQASATRVAAYSGGRRFRALLPLMVNAWLSTSQKWPLERLRSAQVVQTTSTAERQEAKAEASVDVASVTVLAQTTPTDCVRNSHPRIICTASAPKRTFGLPPLPLLAVAIAQVLTRCGCRSDMRTCLNAPTTAPIELCSSIYAAYAPIDGGLGHTWPLMPGCATNILKTASNRARQPRIKLAKTDTHAGTCLIMSRAAWPALLSAQC